MKPEQAVGPSSLEAHYLRRLETSRKTAAAAVCGVATDRSHWVPHVALVTQHANPNGCPPLYRGKLIWICCILSRLRNNTTWRHMVDTQSQRNGWEMLPSTYLSGQGKVHKLLGDWDQLEVAVSSKRNNEQLNTRTMLMDVFFFNADVWNVYSKENPALHSLFTPPVKQGHALGLNSI